MDIYMKDGNVHRDVEIIEKSNGCLLVAQDNGLGDMGGRSFLLPEEDIEKIEKS